VMLKHSYGEASDGVVIRTHVAAAD
jgi:hypothetical protein